MPESSNDSVDGMASPHYPNYNHNSSTAPAMAGSGAEEVPVFQSSNSGHFLAEEGTTKINDAHTGSNLR